jgi:hypothetical protein
MQRPDTAKTLATAVATAVLTLGAFSLVPRPSEAQMTQSTVIAATPVTAPQPSSQPMLQAGQFIQAEHPTTGGARIVLEKGQRYLELD